MAAKEMAAKASATTSSGTESSGVRTVEQFDREFHKYVTKHGSKGAQAVAMARAELAKYRALVWQDKKLEEANVKQGRLTAAQRQAYEKKIEQIEKALDDFHHSVASYNKTKAMYVFFAFARKGLGWELELIMDTARFMHSLSFALLVAFALLAVFQPWKKYI